MKIQDKVCCVGRAGAENMIICSILEELLEGIRLFIFSRIPYLQEVIMHVIDEIFLTRGLANSTANDVAPI